MNKFPRPFLPLALLIIASVPALADPLGVTNTNGDTSAGSLGSALTYAGADTANSDSITFSSLFNNPQAIDLTGPYGTISKSAGESLSLFAPTRLTISTSYGGFIFTGGGDFYLGNITIIGSTGPTNPDLSVSGGSTAFLTNVSLNSIALNNGALETPAGLTTPANMTVAGIDAINVPSGQTSNFSGAISGTGTLVTNGSGTLVLSNFNSSYSGGTQINEGTVQVSQPFVNVSPLGSGPIAINGAGTLAVTSNGFAQSGTLTAGGGTLALGSAQTVAFSALSRTTGGGLVIIPSGSTTLGSTQKVGFTTMPPIVTNGIIDASIVAANSSTDTSADFLTYVPSNGLERATYSSATQITNGGSNGTTPTSVFEAKSTTNNTVTSPTTLYALKVDSGATVSGGTIMLGDGVHTAGLIIDGNTSTAPTTISGGVGFVPGSEGVVYVGGNGTSDYAKIGSTVSGSNGLTKNGNGFLELANASYTGTTTVNGGTLQIDSQSALSSSGAVNLAGTLIYQNAILTGTINLTADATLASGSGLVVLQGPINGNGHGLTLGTPTAHSQINLFGGLTNLAGVNIASSAVQIGGTIGSANTPVNLTGNGAELFTTTSTTIANPLNLTGGIIASSGTTTFSGSIVVNNTTAPSPPAFNAINAFSGGNITISGTISGSSQLNTEGAGKISVTGSSPNFNTAIVNSASNLDITGYLPQAAVGGSGLISGTGTVGLLELSPTEIIHPGEVGAIGKLTASALSWSWNSDATPQLQFQLSNTSNASSLLDLGTGAFTKISGNMTFALDLLGTGEAGQDYDLINFGAGNTNFLASDFTATDLAPGLSASFEFVTNGDTESLMVDVVPEPGTNALLAVGLFALAAFTRNRARKI